MLLTVVARGEAPLLVMFGPLTHSLSHSTLKVHYRVIGLYNVMLGRFPALRRVFFDVDFSKRFLCLVFDVDFRILARGGIARIECNLIFN